MKKVKRIQTLDDCLHALYWFYYNFYYTDLIMYKQGVIYTKESYQKKMAVRYRILFEKIRKVIVKSKYEEIINVLHKPDEIYIEELRQHKEEWKGKTPPLRVYIPEEATLSVIFISQLIVCEEILEIVKKKKTTKEDFDKVLQLRLSLLPDKQKSYRRDLEDYGYIPRREKKVKKLVRKK